jgi:predicted transcriptional regulator
MRRIARRVKTTFGADEIFSCLDHSLLKMPFGSIWRVWGLSLEPVLFDWRLGVPQREQLVTQVVPGCQQNFKFIFRTCSPGFRRNLGGQLCHYFRGMKQRKGQMIKARVSSKMKRGINDLADERGESEAVIVREALSQYLTSKQKCNRQDWLAVISDGSAKRPQKNKNLKHKL